MVPVQPWLASNHLQSKDTKVWPNDDPAHPRRAAGEGATTDRPCVAPRTPNPGLARTVQEVQRALASASADFQAAIGLATAAVAAQEADRQRWEVLTAALHRRLAVQQEESADFSAVLMGWAVSLGPLTRPVPRPLAPRRGWLSWVFWTSQ